MDRKHGRQLNNYWKIAAFTRKVSKMKSTLVTLSTLILGVLSYQSAIGQSASIAVTSGTETVTTTEPAIIKLAQLYKMADVVAVVRIVSGDTENYKTTIYKAIVVTAFKGTAKEQTLYYGPFSGESLGEEYVVFLLNMKEVAVPTKASPAAYGTVKYLEVFNQGYRAMETSYACIFDGMIPSQSCDYGVRVCTDYIILPKEVRAFPPETNDPPFGCRWVRKSKILSLLDDLAHEPKVVQLPSLAR